MYASSMCKGGFNNMLGFDSNLQVLKKLPQNLDKLVILLSVLSHIHFKG